MNKIIAFLLIVNVSIAQQITTAKIKSVEKEGLYVVKIPSEIRSFSKKELDNLRIFDSKKQETPYFIFQNEKMTSSRNFEKLKITSKLIFNNKYTEIIFENSPKITNQFVLEIANTQAYKIFEISGSNDQKNWFGLMSKNEIFMEKDLENSTVLHNFDIPYNDYKFIKINFDDTKTLPLNIINVGVIKSLVIENSLQKIESKKIEITQNIVEKKTIYKVIFDQKEVVNQISFTISNPKLYHRQVLFYYLKTTIGKKKKKKIEQIDIINFELNTNHNNSFLIPETFEKVLYIEIINNDNIPLSIDKINFFQNQKYLVTELKANEIYTLETGNNLETPNYDLKYFENILEKRLPETSIYDINHFSKTAITKEKSIFQQPWLMWLGIIIGAIVVLYFTINLVKDMNINIEK